MPRNGAIGEKLYGGHLLSGSHLDIRSCSQPTKLKPCSEGNKVIIPADADPTFDPLPIFHRYVGLCDAAHPVHPALWVTSAGNIPTCSWFIRRLRQLFPDMRIAGQSMRAGGATDLAEHGVLPYLIQARGPLVFAGLHNLYSKEPMYSSRP